MKTVIFLGAGASAADGAPLQGALFRDYFKLKRENGAAVEDILENYFKKFWSINVHSDDLDLARFPTFEEALGMLEMARDRQEGYHGFYCSPKSNRISEVIERLIFLLAEVLHARLTTNVHHKTLLEKVGANEMWKGVTFVSLNYDILIDNAIAAAHDAMDLDYAVDFANFRINDEWHAPRADRAIELLKIHGSLNWLYCPVCKAVWLTPKQKGVIELISKRDRTTRCRCCQGSYVPILIPPSYFKEMSNPYLIGIWEKAEQKLHECDQIIFCGYSLPDADIHIKYLLKRGQLNRKHHKRGISVKVINGFGGKKQHAIDEEMLRYHRLFGADVVEYLDKSFEDFAANPEHYLE